MQEIFANCPYAIRGVKAGYNYFSEHYSQLSFNLCDQWGEVVFPSNTNFTLNFLLLSTEI